MNFIRLMLNLGFLLFLFSTVSCGDKEEDNPWKKDTTTKKIDTVTGTNKEIEPGYFKVDSLKFGPAIDVFRVSMNDLMDSYMSISYSLCFDKPENTSIGISLFKEMMSRIDSNSLTGEMRAYWNDYRLALLKVIDDLESTNDLNIQRYHYSVLSRLMTPVIKNYGVKDKVILKYYCDRALNGKGAFWYFEDSPSYTKYNPYLGKETTECMEIIETIKPPKNLNE